MRTRRHAFTLVEIMIVVMIIGLLAALAMPSFRKATDNAREKSCIGNLRVIHGTVTMYATEYNKGSTDTITDDHWSYILSIIDETTPTCPYGDNPYTKPATYGTLPVCPNVDEVPEHVHPGT